MIVITSVSLSLFHRRPKVCGITSLGYDHVDVLGTTIQEITWHKTGICKVID